MMNIIDGRKKIKQKTYARKHTPHHSVCNPNAVTSLTQCGIVKYVGVRAMTTTRDPQRILHVTCDGVL